MNVISLFDGISCGKLALDRAKINYECYTASEITWSALYISKKNNPFIWHVGDIKSFNPSSCDLLLAGSPCQGFSIAGSGNAFKDHRSILYYEFLRILDKTKPKYFLLENVKTRDDYIYKISKDIGVGPNLINSSLFSAQNRERLYWTNIPIAPIVDKRIYLKDIIGEYQGIKVEARGGNKGGIQHYNKKAPCITASCWQNNFRPVQNGIARQFTINETEKLQTLPVDYTKGISLSQRYKVIGNCWTVDVIAHILSGLNDL